MSLFMCTLMFRQVQKKLSNLNVTDYLQDKMSKAWS